MLKSVLGLFAAATLLTGTLTATPQYTGAQFDATTNASVLNAGPQAPHLTQPVAPGGGTTAGVFSLSITGSCPGPVTISVTNATPGGVVAIASGTPGSFTIPGGGCAGTVLGLASPSLLVTLTADALGNASVSGTAPGSACALSLQAVDLTTCGTTTVETFSSGTPLAFPSAGSAVVGSVGFIDAEQCGYFWSNLRGDSVSENLAGPASITSYSIDVDLTSNVLNGANTVTWQVSINGVVVDLITNNVGDVSLASSSSFPAIVGPNYTVTLTVLNEVPGGGGSVALRYAGLGNNSVTLN